MKTNSWLVSMMALAFAVFACTEPQPADNVDDGENPGSEIGPGEDGPGEDGPGEDGPGDNPGVPDRTDEVFPFYEDFPIECGRLLTEGSDVGVTIEVTKVEDMNFVFELRPGAMVQSFTMDVYPIAQLYNNLLNDKNYGVLQPGNSVAVSERIRSYLFNAEGGGGFSFSIKDEAFQSNPEDFLQIEFDWMNTVYSQTAGIAIPDCGFIIAVVASVEETVTSANQEELTLCYVHTGSRPLVGDPQVNMEVTTSYTSFGVLHHLNNDAAGYYYFGGLASEIDNYIETFGDGMFRDFVRTLWSAPVMDSSNPDDLSYGSPAPSGSENATVAVAVDANLTPQKDYSRVDFKIDVVPVTQENPVPKVTINKDKVAAAYFEFNVEMSKQCKQMFWTVYTESEKQALEASAEALQAEADALADIHGYGINNENFAWNPEAPESDRATGSGYAVKEACWGDKCVPGAKIYVGFTGVNGYGTASPLAFSEAVTLDNRNLTTPDNCKVKDFKLILDNESRTGFDITVEYDPETVSMVYLSYQSAEGNYGLTENNSWQEWMNLIFNSEYSSQIDIWWHVDSGRDSYSLATGLIPDTIYQVFCCAEDFDGNVSKMEFKNVRTSTAVGGPNPTVSMKLSESKAEGKDWRVTYTAVKDVENIRYATIEGTMLSDLLIEGLTSANATKVNMEWMVKYKDRITYEMWKNGIEDWIKGEAGKDAMGQEEVFDEWAGNGFVIAACVAIGRNEDGPVYEPFHLICENGKAKTLEEIFGITE